MKKLVALAALAALAACGQQGAQGGKPGGNTTTATSSATTAATPAAFELSCAAFASVTGASLEQRYGAANVVQQNIPGPEGGEQPATVLFPNDPSRRVEIMWNDDPGRTNPATITISGTE